MQIRNDFSLKQFNTFGINSYAKYFVTFTTAEQLTELLSEFKKEKRMILGGGSNILLTQNFDGAILKNEVSGIEIVKEDEHHVYIKAGAGENWHKLVLFCLDRDLAGVENLALIPGNVGASPMQNIGAYGVELKDVFDELEAYHLDDHRTVEFSTNDCHFGYRDSIFKQENRGHYAILSVTFRLNKIPRLNTSYGAINEELEKMNVPVTIRSVAQAVINICTSKLPDPKEIGNAGSFFKNPTVERSQYEEIKRNYAGAPGYIQEDGRVKLAAGWLIEQCGWKGYRKGDAGVHARQALVLVNYGNATGNEIYSLSEEIRQSVLEKFKVALEREVNII